MTQLERQPRSGAKSATSRSGRLAAINRPEDAQAAEPVVAPMPVPHRRPWYLSTIGLALAGSVLMWAAFPPLDLGMLAWVAPVCWLVLVRREHLDGRRPYLNILVAGFVFWLAALQWLTLPHWSSSIGWLALSAYLSIYVALFIGLSRVAVHRLHIPTVLVAPIVWTGLELARAHLLTGFLMASLAHTQYKWTAIIQISDLAGAYGVTFLVMLVAACVARMLPIELHRPAIWPLAPLVAAMTAALCYGYWRMDAPQGPLAPKIAVVQGNINTVFGGNPEAQREEIRTQYKSISQKAVQEHPEIELLVWPESMYWIPHVVIEPDAWLPAEMLATNTRLSPEMARQYQQQKKLPGLFTDFAKASRREMQRTVAELGGMTLPLPTAADSSASAASAKATSAATAKTAQSAPLGPALMLGMDTENYISGGVRRYSSSVCVDRSGNVAGCYHKMHPVLFGEYVPLGEYIPALYSLTPLPGGLSVGDGPKVFDIGGIQVAPNICYETVMPHLIRCQVDTLRRNGTEPDLLITQTNDGWFRGSSALDMHMICSVFRAVECRKPMLVAANTGISAAINGSGQIVARLERGEQNYLLTDLHLDSRYSPYVRYGDTLGIACAVACGLLLLVALADRFWGRTIAPGSARG